MNISKISFSTTKGLLEDELGLGHGTISGIDDEADTIDHAHDTLDFTTEISVTGGIDDVDMVVLLGVGVVVDDGSALGENGDTTLTLEGVGVHETHFTFGHAGTGRLEERVDEGGLTVIDVSNDSDVTHERRAVDLVGIDTLVTESFISHGAELLGVDGGSHLHGRSGAHGATNRVTKRRSREGAHGSRRQATSSKFTCCCGQRLLNVTQHDDPVGAK